MQAVNTQMQAVPNQEDFRARPDNAKKTDAEPVRNGDSFLAMVKKMIAAGKDENANESQKNNENLSEKSAQKEAGMPKTGEKPDLKPDKANKAEDKSEKLSANAKKSLKDLKESAKMLDKKDVKQFNTVC